MNTHTTATVDIGKLRNNLLFLQSRCAAGARLCAVLKADAYGHSLAAVVPEIQRFGVAAAAVATLPEAIELRKLGWSRQVIALTPIIESLTPGERSDQISAYLDYRIDLVLSGTSFIHELDKAAELRQVTSQVHLKIDTGMGRVGVLPGQVAATLDKVLGLRFVRLKGICTHFASADNPDLDDAKNQLRAFRGILNEVYPLIGNEVTVHASNTAATLQLPEAHFDMVRCGLGLFGYAPADHLLNNTDLRPTLRLTSRINVTKVLPTGHSVGYGPALVTRRRTRIGIVPVGYADGFDRRIARFGVLGSAHGDLPILGNISMDQLTVDLTDHPAVDVGSEVVLIDDNPLRPNSVVAVARQLGTIPHEITCRLGTRIRRVAVDVPGPVTCFDNAIDEAEQLKPVWPMHDGGSR